MLAGDQWDLEAKVIRSMQHKLAFKRNPRFDYMLPAKPKSVSAGPLLERPAFGVTKPAAEHATPKSKSFLSTKPHTSFVCEPEEVLITDWKAGQVIDVALQVRLRAS